MREHGHISRLILLTIIAMAMAIVACASPLPIPNPLSTSPSPTPTLTPTSTPRPPKSPLPQGTATPTVIELVWWTPAWFSPQSQDPAGEFLAERVKAFEKEHPNVRVTVLPKPAAGKASITNYLQSAYKVAPSLLPDLVVINLADLHTLSALGIFQPLDDLLPQEVKKDVYPFALAAGRVDDNTLAIQFEADFYHLAYRQQEVPTPPATWETLLNGNTPYLTWVFSGPNDVSDVVVLQYVTSGGKLPDKEPVPLDEQALLNLFNYYDQGFRRGIIPERSKEPLTADMLWQSLTKGEVPMADVFARRHAREGLQQVEIAAAPIPTWDGQPSALTRGWGLAITTNNPARREAALALAFWLLAPDTLGPWSQMAGYIPARRSALDAWNVPSSYRETIHAVLQQAVPYPNHPSMVPLRQALAAGLQELVQKQASPEDAVRRAREAYNP